MKYFIVMYGMGGGFNTSYYEVIKAMNLEDAQDAAYEMAKDEYENYAGLHGLESMESICEEHELDINDEDDAVHAEEIYNEEREGWIDHWAKLYSKELEDSLKDEGQHFENAYKEEMEEELKEDWYGYKY